MANRELTNAVAKSIYENRNGHGCKPWSFQTMSHKQPYLDDAEAAIAIVNERRAAIAAVEAEGWQLVPVEPTAEMVEAGFLSLGKGEDASVLERDVYRAMLAAAPKPAAPEVE